MYIQNKKIDAVVKTLEASSSWSKVKEQCFKLAFLTIMRSDSTLDILVC